VQGQSAGAKGMWVLHPDPEYQVADGLSKIWIRNLQNKVKLDPLHEFDSTHRIFDLVAPSCVTGPSRLSSQTLVNLVHNGVSTELLKELITVGLHIEIRQLIERGGTDSMSILWRAVERVSRVVMCRLNNLLGTPSLALQCDGVLRLVFWSRRNGFG
jgi:RNA-dependent RNA polymerase